MTLNFLNNLVTFLVTSLVVPLTCKSVKAIWKASIIIMKSSSKGWEQPRKLEKMLADK